MICCRVQYRFRVRSEQDPLHRAGLGSRAQQGHQEILENWRYFGAQSQDVDGRELLPVGQHADLFRAGEVIPAKQLPQRTLNFPRAWRWRFGWFTGIAERHETIRPVCPKSRRSLRPMA